MKRITKLLLAALVLGAFSMGFAQERPSGVECIAPADPGGGWDFTCRSVGELLRQLDLIDGSVQTQNMTGAGGGVAYAHTVAQREGDPNVLIAASTVTATRLAQDQFQGMDADDVFWLTAIGADFGIIAVRADAPWDDLGSFLDDLVADPNSIRFAGGSAPGGWDHMRPLMLAKEAGLEDAQALRYISFSAGGPSLVELMAGRVEAVTTDISEALGQLEAGEIKILAVLAEERLPGDLADIPTAVEQGYDVIGANWRGFYLPAGLTDEQYATWVDIMTTLEASEAWEQTREQNALAPFFLVGDDFDEFVRTEVERYTELSRELGIID